MIIFPPKTRVAEQRSLLVVVFDKRLNQSTFRLEFKINKMLFALKAIGFATAVAPIASQTQILGHTKADDPLRLKRRLRAKTKTRRYHYLRFELRALARQER
jgi:hypothetical protein